MSETKTTMVRYTAIRLIVAVAFWSASGQAQEPNELSELIFDRVPLAADRASPRSISNSATTEVPGSAGVIERNLAVVEPLRRSGEASPELIEALGLLAVAYQNLDRHAEALDVLDEAIGVTVDAGGRDNLEQVPLLKQKTFSYLALGEIGRTDDTEERIYALYERSFEPGGRQMYYATINLADWQTTAYYKENYAPDRQMLQRQRFVMDRVQRCIRVPRSEPDADSPVCESNPIFTGEIRDVFDQDINDSRLRRIDRLYAGYQQAMLERGNVQLDIVIDLAKRVARLAFATKQEMDFERDNPNLDPSYDGSREQAFRNAPARMDESYDLGVAALKYAIEVPSSVAEYRPEALAARYLDLADWHLAYGKAAAAEEAYGRGYEILLEAGFTSANIDRGFATDVPQQIPVFATHLYSRRSVGLSYDVELEFRGYVDVRHGIDSLGHAVDIEILGGPSDSSGSIERLIERQLKSMKFRPALEGGELRDAGPVEVRYYYAY